MQTLRCTPFVKWAGGKTQLLRRLDQYFPPHFNRYHEPFIGGGAVFFHLASASSFPARISDVNEDLIECYKTIRDRVDDLLELLLAIETEWHKLAKADKPRYYYMKRDNAPDQRKKVERAAWFIFLNKTAYNGLYRVNKSGKFNVPYGDYPGARLCDEENLRAISTLLQKRGVEISCEDYEVALGKVEDGDFLYLDPPYHPDKKKGGFTDYTRNSFSDDEQIRLARVVGRLLREKKGCKILLSNSDSELIRELYASLKIERLQANRMINSVGSKRTGAVELLIRNF